MNVIQLSDLVAYLKTFIIEISPEFQLLNNLIDTKLPTMVDILPAQYGDEMKGSSQAFGLPLDEIVLYNIFYEISSLVLFKTTTFLGYIGSLTGIKPGIFNISINERNSLKCGYIGLIEWIFNINRNQSFITFVIRDMLTKSDSYDETVKYLADVSLLAPCYYIIAVPKAGQVRASQTNYDNWKKQPIYDDRLTPCMKCMEAKGKNQVTFQSLFNVLSSRPMPNKETVYISLMEPATGRPW
ncbi:unnamed protein product [Rotaria sp. Silwood1]|nr:unnamed protein product [Rotaria sp. Silwood1]CAF0966721.1 unnamed protein product [Rotaria sp. Silwood1]